MKNGQIIPYSTNAVDFCGMYGKIRENARFSNKKILEIHFEDLIYNYQNTVRKIEEFVGLNEAGHVSVKQKFNPAKSINNTQLFARKKFRDEGVSMIEKDLAAYCYPFDFVPDFDDSKQVF